MPWQKWFLLHALELHPTEVDEQGDPVFRFRKVILLVGRQNGKSTVMQALTLWRMYVDRCSLVIGTAQDLEIAESLWAESVEMAEETEELSVEIAKVEKGAGRKKFRLRTGEEYKVKAATRRGGRGLSGELVLLDELREHQSWDAWGAVTKTTNAKSRAQVYGISNAGDATSIVLRYLRKMAHADLGDPDGLNTDEAPEDLLDDGEEVDDSALAIFEWSAAPGASISDRDSWAQANPALGWRIRESTLASDARTDPEWIFRTEVLCQWSDGSLEGPFPPGSWEATTEADSAAAEDSDLTICVTTSWDRSTTYIGVAGWRPDGLPHVEVIAQRTGSEWVVPWLTDTGRDEAIKTAPVVVQSNNAPESGLIEPLRRAGVEVVEWKGPDLGISCGDLYDRVRAAVEDGEPDEQEEPAREIRVYHRPQPVLDLAAATAVTKPLGDAWVWDLARSPNDAAPLKAVTGALWALLTHEAEELPDADIF